MHKNTPLDIPEIRLIVASYLKKPDLANCLRVCRAWYEAMLPVVWKETTIDCGPGGKSLQKGPLPDILQARRFLVKTLHIADYPARYPFTCPALHTLNLSPREYRNRRHLGSNPGVYPSLFLDLNTSIVKLHLTGMDKFVQPGLWKALVRLIHLKEMHLSISDVLEEDMNRFWTLFQQLAILQLSEVEFISEALILAKEAVFPQMRVLGLTKIMGMSPEDQLALLRRCPYLQELEWHPCIDAMHFVPWVVEAIATGSWSRLEGVSTITQAEEDQVQVLDSLERATKITIRNPFNNRFESMAFHSLERHFTTLVELNLSDCPKMASTMFRDILCSCPRLISLSGHEVLAKDIVNGGPWACLSLKKMKFRPLFSDEGQREALQPLILKRLSNLKRLEELAIGAILGIHAVPSLTLTFQLQNGLDLLSSLERLEYLTMDSQRLDFEDVEWMIDYWEELVQIRGHLNPNPDIGNQLKDMLLSSGIKTTTT
ncbi:hypothetical protein EDD21DRAFT_389585 [Dissophora ornata]|nr:hypothetical protein EDD21DRAFT_389585 [Dissophora ornata]